MATVVFCRTCCHERGWDRVRPPMRTSESPCEFCGGFDQIRQRKRNPRTGVMGEPKLVNLKNFTHDDQFLVGMPAESKLQRAIGE